MIIKKYHGFNLPHNKLLKVWRYIDFNKDNMDSSDLGRFFYKRKSFSFENELRIIISLRIAEECGVSVPEEGILVPVKLEKLINNIYIAPQMNNQYIRKVTELLEKYQLKTDIVHSNLNDDPIY